MKTYREYCPIAKGAEIVGDRWNLLIFREMLAGVSHFNELQRLLPGISRSVLARRLAELQKAGIVVREGGDTRGSVDYRLTDAGRELESVVTAIGGWAARWAFPEPRGTEMDPLLVMVWLVRHLNQQALPDRRVVIRFQLQDSRTSRFWLLLEPDDPSLCMQSPGFDEDLHVTARTSTMYDVYFGRISVADAIAAGRLTVDGMPRDQRAFASWFGTSAFAPLIPPRMDEPAAAWGSR